MELDESSPAVCADCKVDLPAQCAEPGAKINHAVNAEESIDEMGEEAIFSGREIRSCSACGTKFSATSEVEFRPVCALHPAGSAKADLTDSSSEPESDALQGKSPRMAIRFADYELARGENGKPIELESGGMGITYKAFDVDLRIQVTLKAIGKLERSTGREWAFQTIKSPRERSRPKRPARDTECRPAVRWVQVWVMSMKQLVAFE